MNRREVLRAIALGGATAAIPDWLRAMQSQSQPHQLMRAIPSSGERIPVMGLGTWITFNVGSETAARQACADVIRRFIDRGGKVIDSSPMYGSAQEVIGWSLARLAQPAIFSADKVWTSSATERERQLAETGRRWGTSRFDLLQVHNLEGWRVHLPRLQEMKAAGRVRYIGVTTSHGRRTAETEEIVRAQKIDFVQVTYNIDDRELDQRVIPLAADRGVAVLVNRPFQEGSLIRQLQGKPLPAWAGEIDCATWPPFLLKFIVSHPAVTCVIPATASVAHVTENMTAGLGRLPDAAMRARMVRYFESL